MYPAIGTNYAPKRPLDELATNKVNRQPNTLTDALSKKYQQYMRRDEQVWQEAYDIGQMVDNLTNGKLLMLRHAITNRFLFVQRKGRFTDNKTVGGTFQFYITKLLADWLASNPMRDPICPSDDDQIEEFIEGVKIIQDYYDTRFFDDQYQTKEFMSLACFGTSVTRYRFDPFVQDIICELLPFTGCRWDVRFRAEESPFFIYESKCATSVLEEQLDFEVASDANDTENYGLQIFEQISKQGGNVAGRGKERPRGVYGDIQDETVVTEMWLRPEEYVDIKLNADEPTLGGQTLKQGQKLIEVFPDGMCAVGINGLKTITGLYPESHKDHIVTGIYHVRTYSGLGKGVSDAVDVKKEMDDLYSQTMAYVRAHGTPSWGYNKDIVSEQQARDIGKPNTNIAFDFTNAPDGVNSINQAIQALVPGNPGQGVWQMGSQLENYLQMAFQVTSFSDGMPGVNNRTATGAQIGEQTARTMLVPQHRNKADQRKRSDKVIFNLAKKYLNKPKFFATRDINGITMGKTLSGTQFDGVDIDFEIIADSEVARTPLSKQMGLQALLQSSNGLGGLIQAIQMNPALTGEVANTFGAEITVPKQKDVARVCRKRIEQIKVLLQGEMQKQQIMTMVTGQPVDNANLPESIVSQVYPPISPFEPYYEQKVAWLAAFLDLDEMQFAQPMMRHCIEEMIRRHVEMSVVGKAEFEQSANMGTVMSQLPMLLGDQAMSNDAQRLQADYQMQQQKQAQQDAMENQRMQIMQNQQQSNAALTQARAEHQMSLVENNQLHSQKMQLQDNQLASQEAIAEKQAAAQKRAYPTGVKR